MATLRAYDRDVRHHLLRSVVCKRLREYGRIAEILHIGMYNRSQMEQGSVTVAIECTALVAIQLPIDGQTPKQQRTYNITPFLLSFLISPRGDRHARKMVQERPISRSGLHF